MPFINHKGEVERGESAWSPLNISVAGAKFACRVLCESSWTNYAWLPGIDAEQALAVVEDELNWGEFSGTPGGQFGRRPHVRQVKGGCLAHWRLGLDV